MLECNEIEQHVPIDMQIYAKQIVSKVSTMRSKTELMTRLLPYIVDLQHASLLWSSLQASLSLDPYSPSEE